MEQQPHANDHGSSEPDERAVQEQLERVLAHPAFKNSRRSQSLLRYIVERRGVSGDGHLKERTLGAEVFGRQASYDTNADPVVRIVAGEVRKRIAQYYHEPGHDAEIRIDLPLGSYRPEFHASSAPTAGLAAAAAPAPELIAPPVKAAWGHELPLPASEGRPKALTAENPSASRRGGSGSDQAKSGEPPFRTAHGLAWWVYALSGLALAALLGIVARGQFARVRTPAGVPPRADTAMTQFWRPILNATVPVQVGVGPWPGLGRSSDQPKNAAPFVRDGAMQPVGWWDFVVASKVAGLLQKNGRDFRMEDASATNLSALSQGPSVMIGGFNNQWVIKLTRGLRFHFAESDDQYRIIDRDAPGRKYLASPGLMPGSVRRYALVARLLDPTTAQYLVILAGVGPSASNFAGSVATNPREMEILAAQLPMDWEAKNVEVIISGQVVGGQPGGPHIVAFDVW